MYKDEYVYLNIGRGVVWKYNGIIWEENKGPDLRSCISDGLADLYEDRGTELQLYLSTLDPEDPKRKSIQEKVDAALKIATERCSNSSQKDKIFKEVCELFRDDSFFDKIDEKNYLMACNNGVIDFKNKEFRKGRPDDYLTQSTNISFHPISHQMHNKKKPLINDFMEKLFVNQEIRNYMWNHLSGSLRGDPSINQSLWNYIGIGSNGKSVLTDFMRLAIGDYYQNAPISLICKGRNKIGGAEPEKLLLRAKRFVVLQEPEFNDSIHEGPMKELVSGVEPLSARGLYKEKPVEFKPQFSLVVCCNQLINVQSQDHGTWRRLKVVKFDSLFTDNPVSNDPHKPFQFQKDDNLVSEKLPEWKETFLAMLVDLAFKNEGRVKNCKSILEASAKYRESQDYLAQFVNDKIIRIEGINNMPVKKESLTREFKEWYKNNIDNRVPKSQALIDYLDKEFGRNTNGIWRNIAIKPPDYSLPTEETILELEEEVSI
jgi:P4 family phage/plasmid primase-like protien